WAVPQAPTTDNIAVAEEKAGLDRFGDPLPPAAIARLGTTRFRHGFRASQALFTPDGRLVTTDGQSVRFWALESGKELHRWPPEEQGIRLGHFSPDGKLVSAMIGNGPRARVVLLETATARVVSLFGAE